MEEKLRAVSRFIDSLLENGALKLRRSFGVGLYLYNQLKDEIPDYFLNSLQQLDRMPFEKKKAILLELRRILSSEAPAKKKETVPKKPLKAFFTPLEKLSFLEDKEVKLLKSLGINTLFDALTFFPLKYEDRRPLLSLKLAKTGRKAVFKLRVKGYRMLNEGGYTAEVICTDGEMDLKLKFRYKKVDFIPALFRKGTVVTVMGKLKNYKGERYIVHPEVLKEGEYGKIFPVYYIRTKSDELKLPSKTKHKRIRSTLEKVVTKTVKFLPDYLPQEILQKYRFPDISETIENLHLPENQNVELLNSFSTLYHRRAIYDDLFTFQLSLLLRKKEVEKEKAPKVSVNPQRFVVDFEKKLSFRLTNAQKRSLLEILQDISSDSPMNRLLQGDVGSGKTVVAVGASLAVVREGLQVAVMVPTEILARQHYKRFKEFFDREGFKVGLLVGSLTPAQKRSVYRHIREGNLHVVVGTHALIQDKVEFKNLGLVIIDEQHRFGVMQRKLLLEKGKGLYPHCLVMSATPIPRTLALSIYGDLDISVIDELPPGRKQVRTTIVYESEEEKLIEAINRETSAGNKVYIIYPLIEESEKLDLKSATEAYEKWKSILKGKKVFLLHGRMNDKEKEEVMERFKEKGDVLVSTTVIEVGVDVPEATLMIIESAHRFGLSQLHQLRGRVGRSDRPSYCYLVVPDSLARTDSQAMARLRALVKTNDGFKIAEMDLKLRGPGELLGVSQSGYFGFNIANLARSSDRELLIKARQDAQELLEKDPELKNYRNLRELLLYKYGDRLDLGHVA